MGALRGLVYFKSICVDVPFKINVGLFSNEQQLYTKKWWVGMMMLPIHK